MMRQQTVDADCRLGEADMFVGIERTSKLVVAWRLGERSMNDTETFTNKLNRSTSGQFQITTDGFATYKIAIPNILGGRVDFMTLVKTYGVGSLQDQRQTS